MGVTKAATHNTTHEDSALHLGYTPALTLQTLCMKIRCIALLWHPASLVTKALRLTESRSRSRCTRISDKQQLMETGFRAGTRVPLLLPPLSVYFNDVTYRRKNKPWQFTFFFFFLVIKTCATFKQDLARSFSFV